MANHGKQNNGELGGHNWRQNELKKLPEGPNPMTMSFWRSWIVLWAFMPVFSGFFALANHRVWNDTLSVQPHHAWGIGIVLFGSAILFVVAPGAILNRHIKSYGPDAHLLACLAA